MNTAQSDARSRILQATIALLSETDAPDKITVRQIAGRANVGVGSINYYYHSKGNLLNEAIISIIKIEAVRWLETATETDFDPVDRLKMVFKETARIAIRYPQLAKIAFIHNLQHGEATAPLLFISLLREIFGEEKSERELRLLALQLTVPMQVMFLWAPMLPIYAGIDIFDERQREETIDTMIDNLVKK